MLRTKHFDLYSLKLFILYKFFYLKYYFPFMFAHKPLCQKYEKDTIFLFNKIYFCRSCFCLYLGSIAGLLFGLFFIPNIFKYYVMLFLLTGLTILFSHPSIYKIFTRRMRDLMRFLAGFLGISTITVLAKINLVYLTVFVLILISVKHFYNKKRSGKYICSGCNELNGNRACSGYRKQTDALLKLEENFSKYLTIRKELLHDKS